MDIDPQRVIEILARRIASEVISSAMKEAALETLTKEQDVEPEKSP